MKKLHGIALKLINKFLFTKGMRKCNNNAAYVDKLMEKMGVKINHWKMMKIQMVETAFVFAFIISIIKLSDFILTMKEVQIRAKTATDISFAYPVLIMSITDLTFTNIIK